MPSSSFPTLDEIRRVYRLLGECTELGTDPIVWRQHLAEGSSLLIGEHFVNVVESRVTVTPAGIPVPTTLGYFNGGPLPNERFDLIKQFMERPAEISPMVPALLGGKQPAVTRLRHELVPDKAWDRSVFFQEYLRPLGLHDQVTSVVLAAPHAASAICWMTCVARKCSVRSARLLDFLHQELSWLKRAGKLAPLGGFSLTDLSPRQRQILFGLFRGDSEKQLARRLGISPHTVHDHLKLLHRRFGVQSRGELISRCLKYWPALAHLEGNEE